MAYGSRAGCLCRTHLLVSTVSSDGEHVSLSLWGTPGGQNNDVHLTLHVGLRVQCNYQASSLATLTLRLLHYVMHVTLPMPRYTYITMMTELQKDSIKLDDDSERKVVQSVLRLVEDKNGEVQNLAVKW